MAKDTISFTIIQERAFQAALKRASKQIGSLKTPLKLISDNWYRGEKYVFDLNRKGPGKYADFKNEESRQAKIRAVGFEYPLLVRTGKLMRSVISPTGEGALNKITHTTLIIGTSVKSKKGAPYPLYLQLGTKNMEARPFLFIGPEVANYAGPLKDRPNQWLKILDTFVEQKLNANLDKRF